MVSAGRSGGSSGDHGGGFRVHRDPARLAGEPGENPQVRRGVTWPEVGLAAVFMGGLVVILALILWSVR